MDELDYPDYVSSLDDGIENPTQTISIGDSLSYEKFTNEYLKTLNKVWSGSEYGISRFRTLSEYTVSKKVRNIDHVHVVGSPQSLDPTMMLFACRYIHVYTFTMNYRIDQCITIRSSYEGLWRYSPWTSIKKRPDVPRRFRNQLYRRLETSVSNG